MTKTNGIPFREIQASNGRRKGFNDFRHFFLSERIMESDGDR